LRYRTYNSWLRERFGERIHKVVVDAGFTCPNRDGTRATGGCTYCNNTSFRPPLAIQTRPIAEQVASGIAYLKKRVEARKFIVYFQPFTNTYDEVDRLHSLYTEALAHPDVVGLAIGTRPDCVDEPRLAMIDELARQRLVCLEFGVESIYDSTLRRVNRAHDYRAFVDAMALCRGRRFHTGAHLILGFPWETRGQWLTMADEVSRVGIDMLKIHHLHLVRGTALAREHLERPFRLLSFPEYADLVCDFLERLRPGIVIERLFGEAPTDLLVAPKWGLSRDEVLAGLRQRMEERDVVQGAGWSEDASPQPAERSHRSLLAT
jgi:uncharacterized protein